MGVFSRENQPTEGRKRNAFDGSCQVNTTFKFGELIPCLCREIIPGDSFRINTAFGLRFMPLAFPIQTKVKAKIDFFYVRYRNLWNGWKNWYFKTGQPDSFPILSDSEALEQSKTGSLGDYLGLPSTVVQPSKEILNAYAYYPPAEGDEALLLVVPPYGDVATTSYTLSNLGVDDTISHNWFIFRDVLSDENWTGTTSSLSLGPTILANGMTYNKLPLVGDYLPLVQAVADGKILVGVVKDDDFTSLSLFYNNTSYPLCIAKEGALWLRTGGFPPNSKLTLVVIPRKSRAWDSANGYQVSLDDSLGVSYPSIYFSSNDVAYNVVDYSSFGSSVPYRISAMPFRAYEQIYNAFYRDDRNNPYFVNGVQDPNVFIPSMYGGVDDNKYRIRYRNWEQDFLTTALPSPQYGNAPLVGITSSGVAQFQSSDGSIITSKLETASNGDTIVGFSTTNVPSVNRSLTELASSGISINDLRGVNSLQRFLEAKYRACLRYRDQMKIHFNSEIKYDEMDMPEFLGSVTSMCNIDQINQNSATVEDNPLGSYAGQMSCMGSTNGSIQHYFDEPGLLMAIVSVVPVPCYSQLLPKHFTKVNDSLEYYFSEFAHLGFQAIPYREVCPLQAALNGVSLDSTFGYQRPWYDYISSQDEVHGQFRTTLNNFVLSRVFNQVPSLNEDFLTVRPESLNDVFTVNSVEDPNDPSKMIPVDTILGQIHFDITMQRPIPRFGVPRLE